MPDGDNVRAVSLSEDGLLSLIDFQSGEVLKSTRIDGTVLCSSANSFCFVRWEKEQDRILIEKRSPYHLGVIEGETREIHLPVDVDEESNVLVKAAFSECGVGIVLVLKVMERLRFKLIDLGEDAKDSEWMDTRYDFHTRFKTDTPKARSIEEILSISFVRGTRLDQPHMVHIEATKRLSKIKRVQFLPQEIHNHLFLIKDGSDGGEFEATYVSCTGIQKDKSNALAWGATNDRSNEPHSWAVTPSHFITNRRRIPYDIIDKKKNIKFWYGVRLAAILFFIPCGILWFAVFPFADRHNLPDWGVVILILTIVSTWGTQVSRFNLIYNPYPVPHLPFEENTVKHKQPFDTIHHAFSFSPGHVVICTEKFIVIVESRDPSTNKMKIVKNFSPSLRSSKIIDTRVSRKVAVAWVFDAKSKHTDAIRIEWSPNQIHSKEYKSKVHRTEDFLMMFSERDLEILGFTRNSKPINERVEIRMHGKNPVLRIEINKEEEKSWMSLLEGLDFGSDDSKRWSNIERFYPDPLHENGIEFVLNPNLLFQLGGPHDILESWIGVRIHPNSLHFGDFAKPKEGLTGSDTIWQTFLDLDLETIGRFPPNADGFDYFQRNENVRTAFEEMLRAYWHPTNAKSDRPFYLEDDAPGMHFLNASTEDLKDIKQRKPSSFWTWLRDNRFMDEVRSRIKPDLIENKKWERVGTNRFTRMHGDLTPANVLFHEETTLDENGKPQETVQFYLCDFSDAVVEVDGELEYRTELHDGEQITSSSFFVTTDAPRINPLLDLANFVSYMLIKAPYEANAREPYNPSSSPSRSRDKQDVIDFIKDQLPRGLTFGTHIAKACEIGEGETFERRFRFMVFERCLNVLSFSPGVGEITDLTDEQFILTPQELLDIFYPDEKESSISTTNGRLDELAASGRIRTIRIREDIKELLRSRPHNTAEILEHINKASTARSPHKEEVEGNARQSKSDEHVTKSEVDARVVDVDARVAIALATDPVEDRRDQASSPSDGAVGLLTSIGTNPLNVLDTLEFARVKGCTHVGYVLSDRAKPEKERYAKMMSDFAHHRSPGMVIEDLTEAFEDVDEPWKLPAPMLTTLAQGLSLDDPHDGGRMLAVDASGSPGFTAWCMAAKGLEAVEFHEHQGTTFSVDDQAQADDPVVGNQEWKSLLVVEHFLDGKQRFDFPDVPFHATLELNETSSVDTHRNLWFNLHRNGEEEFGSSSEDGKKKHLLLSSSETSELLALMNQIQHIGGRFSFARTWMRFNAEGLLGGHSVLSIGGKFILKLQNIAQRSGLIRFPNIRPDFESDGEWAPMQALLYKKGSERVNVRYHAQRRPATEFKSALRIADDLLCSTCSLLVLTRHPEKTIKRIQTIDPTLRPSRVSSFIGEHDLAPEHLFGRDLRDVLNHLPLESTSISQRNAERGQEWLHAARRLMVHEVPEKKTIRSKATYTNDAKTHIDLSSRESDLVSALVGTKEFGSVLFLSESELVEELGEHTEDGQEATLQYTSKRLNLMPTLRNQTSPDSISLSLQANGDLRAHLFDHTFSNDLLAVFHKILRYNSLDFATPVPVLLVNRNLLAAWKNNRRLTVLEDLNFLEQALGPAFDYRFIVCDQGPISVQDLVNLHLNHGRHGKRWVVDPDGLHLVGQGRCEDMECERAMCQFGINCEWAEGDCRFCHCSLTYSDVEEE